MADERKTEQIHLLRDHAWDWFALHANQRMQAFNFFLVATGFLVAAYASAIEKQPAIACGVALLGAWVTLWFNRLDTRSKDLVRAGERALRESERQLAGLAESSALEIVEQVEISRSWVPSYSATFCWIQSAIFLVFIVGAVNGFRVALRGTDLSQNVMSTSSLTPGASAHQRQPGAKRPRSSR